MSPPTRPSPKGSPGPGARNGQERILVNCAGVVVGLKTLSRDRTTGALAAFPMTAFQTVLAVNLAGTFRCLGQSALGMAQAPPLADGERGVIINTSSVAGVEGQMGQAAYSASKGGVLALTLPVARDLAQDGIRVNAILPGILQTPMMAGMPEPVQASLAASVPFQSALACPRNTPPSPWRSAATATSTAKGSGWTARFAWPRARCGP